MSTKLLNGCSYTEPWVTPKNWKRCKDLSKNWRVECKFFDPAFKEKYPDGFRFKRRVNRGDTVQSRREAIEALLYEIPIIFEREGYNPITKEFMIDHSKPIAGTLTPDLTISSAFQVARELLVGSDKHRNQIRIAVNRFEKNVKTMRLSHLTIGELNYITFFNILNSMHLKNNYYNKFRVYFMSLFKILIKNQCCKENFAAMLDKRMEIKKIRKSLSIEQIEMIFDFLEENYYEFFRYAKIFFYSGTRSSELLTIQKQHVRLEKQEYDVLIKKRANSYSWETKVIMKDALPFWEDLLIGCKNKEDFIFSKNLSPGPTSIRPDQITRRWLMHVKRKLAFFNGELCTMEYLNEKKIKKFDLIEEDFYSLKHSFLDFLDEQQSSSKINSSNILSLINNLNIDEGAKEMLLTQLSGVNFDIAQSMAAHQSSAITNKVYKVNKKKRENEYLKNIKF